MTHRLSFTIYFWKFGFYTRYIRVKVGKFIQKPNPLQPSLIKSPLNCLACTYMLSCTSIISVPNFHQINYCHPKMLCVHLITNKDKWKYKICYSDTNCSTHYNYAICIRIRYFVYFYLSLFIYTDWYSVSKIKTWNVLIMNVACMSESKRNRLKLD